MKRMIGPRCYGSALGQWLAATRAEIASREAGDGGDAQAVADQLVEELASACEVSAEDYGRMESGDLDPTAEQADKLAEALSKHGVESTGADLIALDKGEEKDEKDPQEEATAAMSQALEAAQGEATQLRASVGERDTELSRLREQVATLSSSVTAAEPLVAAGKAALAAKRADLLKRAELRGTVTPTFRAAVESASADVLEGITAALGLDPLADPLCAGCGKATAEKLYRSSKPPDPGSKPGSVPAERDERTTLRVAQSLQAKHEREGKRLPLDRALTDVRRMPDVEFHALADQA